MGNTAKKFLDLLFKYPFVYLAIAIIFTVLTFVSVTELKEDFTYRIFFEKTDPNLLELEQFEKEFSGSDTLLVAINSPSGIFDPETIDIVRTLSQELWQTPHSIRVDSITNFQLISAVESDLSITDFISPDIKLTKKYLDKQKSVVDDHKFLKDFLVNKAYDTTIINIQMIPDSDLAEFEKAVTHVRKVLKNYDKGDHTYYLNGSVALTYSFKEGSVIDMQKLMPFVIGAALLFLWVCTRTFYGIILSIFMLAFVSIASYGLIAFLDIKIHNLTIFVAQILIGISIADITHILVTYKSFLNKYTDRMEALYKAAEKNLIPTLLTSITTAVGFYSFTISELPALKDFGIMAGSGTLIAWFYTYFFIVPMLTFVAIKAGKPTNNKDLKPTDLAIKFTNSLVKNRNLVYLSYIVLFVIASFLVTKIDINSDPIGYFDKKFPIAKSSDFMREKFGGPISLEVVADSQEVDGINNPDFLKRADQLQNWLKTIPEITNTNSLIDIIKDLNKYLNEGDENYYKIPDNSQMIAQELFLYTLSLPQGLDINNQLTNKQDKLRITAMIDLRDSKDWIKLIDNIDQKANDLNLKVNMTGRPSMFQRMVDPLTNSLIKSLFLAIVLISFIIIFILKSISLGGLSLIPNGLPIILGGSLFPIFGESMDYGSVLVGSICLGIAVDDTIHIVVNYQKHVKEGYSPEESFAKVLTHTAPALFATTITLVVTFGSLMFGSFVPNQNLGKYTAIILVLALIIDLTLLPLLLMKFKQSKKAKEIT